MFFTPFITGLLPILATSTRINTPELQQPSIFILGDHKPSTSALVNALQILGYTYTNLNGSIPELSPHTFTELSSNNLPEDLTIQYPNAKFILPVSSRHSTNKLDERRPCANSWLGHLAAWRSSPSSENESAQEEQLSTIRETFGANSQGRLLEIALDEKESHRGEKWLRLCDFLDLGYSVVERLKLKEFPKDRAQKTSSWGLGDKMGVFGMTVQKSF